VRLLLLEAASRLLLEEILEGLAGIAVAGRRRRCTGSPLLRVRGGGGVLLDGGAKLIERAIVLGVLGCDALGNRLDTLKLRAAVEKAALFATVQLEAALGALTVGVEAAAEHGAAVRTTRAGDGADHARSARAELIGARTALRRLAVMGAVLFLLLFRVAIAAVIILSIHKRLLHAGKAGCLAALGCACMRRQARAHPYNFRDGRGDYDSIHKAFYDLAAKHRAVGTRCALRARRKLKRALTTGRAKARPYNTADLYPIGLLHSTANAIFPRLTNQDCRRRAGDGTTMFLVLWEFEVKPSCEQRFQEVYRPGGDWDSLFRNDPNHVETRLFQDMMRSGVYLTADYWLSRKSYEEFLALRRSEYRTLDAATEDLTLSERHIGSFEML
jgi:hypothetical protein